VYFLSFPGGRTKKNFISQIPSFFKVTTIHSHHHLSHHPTDGNEQDAHPKELTGLLFKNAFDDDDHIRHKHTTTTTETKETAFKIFSKRLFLFLVLSSKAASAQY
jgi:hypothetical protein